MKKLLALLILTLISLTLNAQTSFYFPFPDSVIVWWQESSNQGYNCCCTGAGPCLRDDDFGYFLNGDTLIGSFFYKKISLLND